MMPRRRHLVAAAILLLLAQTPHALGAVPGSPPAFAVQTAGHGLRQYRPGSAETIIVSDDTIEATVARVAGDEWELTLRPKRDTVTAVWFPWEPDKDTEVRGSMPRSSTIPAFSASRCGLRSSPSGAGKGGRTRGIASHRSWLSPTTGTLEWLPRPTGHRVA